MPDHHDRCPARHDPDLEPDLCPWCHEPVYAQQPSPACGTVRPGVVVAPPAYGAATISGRCRRHGVRGEAKS